MTGHGNVTFSDTEVARLREYLSRGGFLHIDDNYGLDEHIRREMKKVFPDHEFTDVPLSHPIYHVVYDFPKTKLVDGPLQIEARIDQNAQLSGQLSLWNQQGSHVRRGTLITIPLGKGLLYAEPIYLQAERSPMPELRIVGIARAYEYATANRDEYADFFGADGKLLGPGLTAEESALAS